MRLVIVNENEVDVLQTDVQGGLNWINNLFVES